ncbi:MAG: GHKL domain-containing protein [Candidatus Omnitrophica bacterium]|nr:GHKL domain-containing protein [Candidatus Omnitrophota bacterium]MDE2223461.1 GHKL domain-containing protein [Candidatus Omnitrophota bacterium]
MTLNQKKIIAFAVFFLLFILQTAFSINALYNLHASQHVIEEEWSEFNRVQSLEDLLDDQSVQLVSMPDGKVFRPDAQSANEVKHIAAILNEVVEEYGSHEGTERTAHERVEEGYLKNIVGPLQAYLNDYNAAVANGGLTTSLAKGYAARLKMISSQIKLLRKADAAFARKAMGLAKKARQQTLRNGIVISVILIIILLLWAAYFLVRLDRQTRLEIYQQKIMTAGLLAQSLAHEIRNPLGVIKGAADILAKRDSLDKESRELAGYMVDEVVRIDSLIKELLSLSRKKSESRENADIGQIIRSALDLTSAKMRQAGVVVHFTQKAEGLLCYCVPGQIRQIILNLLLNALDVSPDNSSIEIAAEKKDNFIIITFRDYGKGIPAQDKERIFDLFYTTKESGFGIGLAVVKRIINEHQGQIDVQSWLGQGSLFTVVLPVRP